MEKKMENEMETGIIRFSEPVQEPNDLSVALCRKPSCSFCLLIGAI